MVATLPDVSTFPPIVSDAVEASAAAFFRGSCGLTHVPEAEVDDTQDAAAIMSSISFVGDLQWAFALAFPEDAAVGLARTFAGFDIPFDSPDMGDVIGEIVNVIAGDVVARLAKQKFTAQMSLPTTVRGSNVSMLTPSDASSTRFVFTGPAGTCWFDLVSTPKPAVVPDQEPSSEPAADQTIARGAPERSPERAEPAPSPEPAVSSTASEPDPAQDAWAAAMAEAERQMAEQDAIDAAARAAGLASGGPAQASPTVVRSGSKLMPLVLVFACAGWGSLLGVLGTSKPPAAAPAEAAAQTEQPAAPKAPTADIDELIRAEQYDDALKACITATKSTPAPSETELCLREALCLEGQGRWGEALDSYRRAETDPDTVASVVAILGQARCATQDGSYVIARALTNRALLRSGNPGCRALPVRKEVHHLQARIALLVSGAKPLPRDASARPLLSASGTNGADWLSAGTAQPASKHDLFEVHRTLGAPKELQVTAAFSRRPASDVLTALAATAGWKVQASPDTVAKLKWAVGPIEVDHLPLNEFLNVLTEGTGVSWAVKADTLVLTQPNLPEAAPK